MSDETKAATTVRADALAVGDVLGMAAGTCEVVALYASHGGVECVVRSAGSKAVGAGTRVLWFWRHQGVPRLRASGRATGGLGARPIHGAAARRVA
jgi:hypothetical protein